VAYLRYYFRADEITTGHLQTIQIAALPTDTTFWTHCSLLALVPFIMTVLYIQKIAVTICLSVCLSPPWQF